MVHEQSRDIIDRRWAEVMDRTENPYGIVELVFFAGHEDEDATLKKSSFFVFVEHSWNLFAFRNDHCDSRVCAPTARLQFLW